MTLAQEVSLCMTFGAVTFWSGYCLRHRMKIHRALGVLGVLITLAGSVYLVANVHLFEREIVYLAPVWVITIHRLVATGVTVLMFLMLYTGLRRQRERHIRMHRYFLYGYTIVYLSGLVLFR